MAGSHRGCSYGCGHGRRQGRGRGRGHAPPAAMVPVQQTALDSHNLPDGQQSPPELRPHPVPQVATSAPPPQSKQTPTMQQILLQLQVLKDAIAKEANNPPDAVQPFRQPQTTPQVAITATTAPPPPLEYSPTMEPLMIQTMHLQLQFLQAFMKNANNPPDPIQQFQPQTTQEVAFTASTTPPLSEQLPTKQQLMQMQLQLLQTLARDTNNPFAPLQQPQSAPQVAIAVTGTPSPLSKQPPTMQQLMQMQLQVFHAFVNNSHALVQPFQQLHPKLEEFMLTWLPTFAGSADPLDAHYWIKDMERKLYFVKCDEHERLLYATLQLKGDAVFWWHNYCDAHHDVGSITWDEFVEAFRAAHIPKNFMMMKRREFLNLRKGNMCVLEYLNKFRQLACFAKNDVADDKDKIWHFIGGLDANMKVHLVCHDFQNFKDMVNKVILLEDAQRQLFGSKKRKMAFQTQQGVADPIPPPTVPTPPPKSVTRSAKGNPNTLGVQYFHCNQMGHYANNCHQKRQAISPMTSNFDTTPAHATPVLGQGRGTQSTTRIPQTIRRGCINHSTTEATQDVLLGNVNARRQTITFSGKIVYCRKPSEVENATLDILRKIECVKASGQVSLGFNLEWKPFLRRGDPPCKVAVMQLCMDKTHCYVMHIMHTGVPPVLKSLLEDSSSIKVGVSIDNDARKMANDYDVHVQPLMDLSNLANVKLAGPSERWSLASLTEKITCKELSKPSNIRMGNWEVSVLSKQQLQYAATDAYISWYLYEVLQHLPDNNAQAEKETAMAT